MKASGTRFTLSNVGRFLAICTLSVMGTGRVEPTAKAVAATPAISSAKIEFAGQMTQGGWIRGVAPAGTTGLKLGGHPVPIAPDGSWFAAFDRDAAPTQTLTAHMPDGTAYVRKLGVSPRDWKIEHVNIARRKSGPSAAFMKIRKPELARINAARAMETSARGWRQSFIWPVKGRISGRFGSQRIYRAEPGSYHSGIDITTGRSGTPFVAPADGVVILATEKPFSLEGNLLMLDHGMGLNSAFLHCSEILVEKGEYVKQGQVIGRIGMSGRATGPHLHWSIKWRSARLDPLLFTGPMD
jgi:hypothetical protein